MRLRVGELVWVVWMRDGEACPPLPFRFTEVGARGVSRGPRDRGHPGPPESRTAEGFEVGQRSLVEVGKATGRLRGSVAARSSYVRDPGGCCCGPFRVRFLPPGLVRPTLLRLLARREQTGFDLMKEMARMTNG